MPGPPAISIAGVNRPAPRAMRASSRAARPTGAARPQTGRHDSHQIRTRRQAPDRATAGPAMPRRHRGHARHRGSPRHHGSPRHRGSP
jgi:hypothetical protein